MSNFDDALDEELLIAARMGNFEAESYLTAKYLSKRKWHAYRAAPNSYALLDDIDLSSVALSSFLEATQSFRFGSSRFQNWFERIFGQNIVREVKSQISEGNGAFVRSLDDPFSDDSDSLCLADYVSGDDNPKDYCDVQELWGNIKEKAQELPKESLKLAKLISEGYKLKDAAKKLKMPYSSAKYYIKRFRRLMDELLDEDK